MSQSLRKAGHDVEIITALPNYPTGKFYKGYRWRLFKKEVMDGLKIKRYRHYPSKSKNKFLRMFSMLSFSISLVFALPALWLRRPDVIIINSPPLLNGFTAVVLARMTGARVITNISDIWPMSALELGAIKKGSFYRVLEKLEKYIYLKSNHLMGQSQETVSHIQRINENQDPFLYMNLSSPSKYIGQGIDISEKPMKIVYAGLLGVAQGVFDICKSVDFKNIGIEFHIYGDGNELEEILKYIDHHPDCNIFYNSMIPKEQVPEMLSNYHAMLIPLKTSIHGALPSKVFVALSSAMPIFFSGEGEGAKIVNDNNLGWVSPSGDFKALENNLISFVSSSEEDLEGLKTNCLKALKDTFDYEKQNQRFIKFIESKKTGKNES